MMFQHGMVTGKKAGTRTNLRNLAFHCSICNRDLFILFLLILQLGPKVLGMYTHIRTWVKAAVEVAAMSLKQHMFFFVIWKYLEIGKPKNSLIYNVFSIQW